LQHLFELFRVGPDEFELVITDKTGVELAKELMQIRPNMPIILCTGFSELIDEEKARNMGIHEFVTKPIGTSGMANLIRRVLDEN